LSEWPVGGPAHRTGVPGEDPPIAASFPKIDNVEIAAEIPAVRSGFLNLEQADDGKIIRELAGCVVALLARLEFESLNVIHPNRAK
jgi:hypothetical protein